MVEFNFFQTDKTTARWPEVEKKTSREGKDTRKVERNESGNM
jgi:hypothetical protein